MKEGEREGERGEATDTSIGTSSRVFASTCPGVATINHHQRGKAGRDEEKTEKKRGKRKEGNVNLHQGDRQPSLAALNRKDMDGQQPV